MKSEFSDSCAANNRAADPPSGDHNFWRIASAADAQPTVIASASWLLRWEDTKNQFFKSLKNQQRNSQKNLLDTQYSCFWCSCIWCENYNSMHCLGKFRDSKLLLEKRDERVETFLHCFSFSLLRDAQIAVNCNCKGSCTAGRPKIELKLI